MGEATQLYRWTGIDKHGRRISGNIQSAGSTDAQNELKKREIEVISIKQSGRMTRQRKQKVKSKDILLFTRYLSTMISAGVPILQALDILSQDQDNKTMAEFITTLKSNVSGGKMLAETFADYPQYFSPMYCNLIKTGEKSGTLDKILGRLGNYLEKVETLKKKVKRAMIYPSAILTVATVVSLILLVFVVPRFQTVFASFHAKLPTFTLAVIGASDFLRHYWWLVVMLFTAGVSWFVQMMRINGPFRQRVDRGILKVYVIGEVLQKGMIAQFTRTLAITLESGMPIVDAMKPLSDVMTNSLYKKAVLDICQQVTSGNPLNVAMNETGLFPHMVVQMIAIGEVSGRLGEMLNKVADYYEEEVSHTVDSLSSLMEPLIIALLGVIIGSFIVAMYLPIFRLGGLF